MGSVRIPYSVHGYSQYGKLTSRSLKSLVIFFGPMLLPKAIARYRSLRTEATQRAEQQKSGGAARPVIHPLSPRSAVILALLAFVAIGHLLSAGLVPSSIASALQLPGGLSQPENVFLATQSRLQAPTDVIFNRLSGLRPNHTLTAADEALRARLASLETRLLYLQYGPSVIADCPFCGGTGVDSQSGFSAAAFSYYAMVDLLALHVFNLVVIAIVTSPLLLLGRKGKSASSTSGVAQGGVAASAADRAYDLSAAHSRRWRTPASILALVFAALDVYMVISYDRTQNARATRLTDVDFFFWTMRTYRGVASGLLMGTLALILYCAASGLHSSPKLGLLGVLLFGPDPPPSPAHRITSVTRDLAGVKSRLSASAIVKNTAHRDTELRARTQAYWVREVMLVAEAMEEREVVEGINDALSNRIDMQLIQRDAETYARNMVPYSIIPRVAVAQQTQPQPQSPQQPEIVVARSTTPVADNASVKKRK